NESYSTAELDRRAHPRTQLSVPVAVESTSRLSGISEDISLGGIRIRIHEDIPEGSIVDLEVAISEEDGTVETHGLIRWKSESQGDGLYYYGIEFLDLAEADRTTLTTLGEDEGASGEESTGAESGFLDAFSSAITPLELDRSGVVSAITLSPRSREELASICRQVLDIQSLWLEVDDPPEMNREVEVVFDMPAHDFEVAFPGRVVHRVDNRIAVDILKIGEEELETLRDIGDRRDHDETKMDGGKVTRLAEETSRVTGDVTRTWDGTAESSLAVSRTFETVSDQPADAEMSGRRWLKSVEVGGDPEGRRGVEPEELVLELSEGERTGLLEFAPDDREYQIGIEQGRVVHAVGRPHKTREALGSMLVV
ncbi:MAG: PilZ domain-containing protein, partial [Bradymonadaceae bacterium]